MRRPRLLQAGSFVVCAAIAWLATTGGAGCDVTNDVVAVDYVVSEFPMSGKYPWSCLVAQGTTDGAGAAALDWAVGAPLVANPVVRFERACGGWFGADCPGVDVATEAIDPSVWTIADGPSPGTAVVGKYLLAVGAGSGGMRVRVDGRYFPPLQLRAFAPSSIRFFRWQAPASTMTPIASLTLAAGASELVVPQLEAEGARRLCGFATMTMTAKGVTATADPTWNAEGRANAPIRVTAGAIAGSGSAELTVGGVKATLPVTIE